MESHRTRHRLTPIFLVIFISMLISCASETKKTPQKIYNSVENNANSSTQIDQLTHNSNPTTNKSTSTTTFSKQDFPLTLTENNTSSFYLDGKIMNPTTTEGYQKQKGQYKQYSITSHSGSEGYFFDLFIPEGQNIEGIHNLNVNGNKLLLNHKEDDLLTVYQSSFCDGNPGTITIDSYDVSQNTISGSLSATVCNNGLIGKRGEKVIQNCRFKDVKLMAL